MDPNEVRFSQKWRQPINASAADSRSLTNAVEEIRSRADFINFIHALRQNLVEKPGEWENRDLPAFLDALAAWVEDMDGYYRNRGQAVPDQPTWLTLGHMLLAAKVYE